MVVNESPLCVDKLFRGPDDCIYLEKSLLFGFSGRTTTCENWVLHRIAWSDGYETATEMQNKWEDLTKKGVFERTTFYRVIKHGWNSLKAQGSFQHIRKKCWPRLKITRGRRIGNGTRTDGQMSQFFSFLIMRDYQTNLGPKHCESIK